MMENTDLAQILIDGLMSLTYDYSSSFGGTYKRDIVSKDHKKDVSDLVHRILIEHYSAKLAALEAEVYTYEAIIANSNFAPMVPKK